MGPLQRTTVMKRYYALAQLPLVFDTPAHADEVSKNTGICTAYKIVAKDQAGAQRAMQTATNKRLANNHGGGGSTT